MMLYFYGLKLSNDSGSSSVTSIPFFDAIMIDLNVMANIESTSTFFPVISLMVGTCI